MPSPFPGMNPYLEEPSLWEEIHTQLIVAIAYAIAPQLSASYRVAIEHRTYTTVTPQPRRTNIPDVAVMGTLPRTIGEAALAYAPEPQVVALPQVEERKERFLEIRKRGTGGAGEEVITAIEILSPSNKLHKEGRALYTAKRNRVLASETHFIEIDLLRAGRPMAFASPPPRLGDYRILVSRAQDRPNAELYAFSVRDPIPRTPIPLQPGDDEPIVDVAALLHKIYDLMNYDNWIDYTSPPQPQLRDADAVWCVDLLQAARLNER